MVDLVPCTVCARHIRSQDERCPFCGQTNVSRGMVPSSFEIVSRSAIAFGVVATLSACSPQPSPPKDPAPAATSASPIPRALDTAPTIAPPYGLPPPDRAPVPPQPEPSTKPVPTASPKPPPNVAPLYGLPPGR